MKFSLPLIKKLVPAVKNKKELIEKLNLHSFEAADAGGNIFDVSIAPNRFSDAASHWGIAGEISAILGGKPRGFTQIRTRIYAEKSFKKPPFRIEIEDKKLCPRYAAQYFENIKVGPSPKWMQKILTDCGLRPVSNVVDIMNYAMLETGQPLHAFDYDKLTTSNRQLTTIIVRKAKKGEKIRTIDDKLYDMSESILVIADSQKPIAIAGIKGGKDTEVDKNTKRILVEAANFDGVSIYKSSRLLKLATDASLRFSHNISSELVPFGLGRAAELLKEIVGAKAGGTHDVNSVRAGRKIIKFDPERFHRFIGIKLESGKIRDYLERLGFTIIKNSKLTTHNSFLVEVSPLRQDIETFEDLAEEVARLYGYNNVKSTPPHIHIIPSGFEDQIVLKDKTRRILLKMGLDEVYNYSFVGESVGRKLSDTKGLIEVENPISNEFHYLRPTLAAGLLKNIEGNFRFFNTLRIFEIGKVFQGDTKNKETEKLVLGITFAAKNEEIFFDLKGAIRAFLGRVGLVDYLLAEGVRKKKEKVDFFTKYLEPETTLKIESGGAILGHLGRAAGSEKSWKISLAEIDLGILLRLVSEEHEYRPLPKYPSMMRDISMTVPEGVRVGDIMQAIQEFDLKYIEDVDLIDEYEGNLTFRIVFQSEDRTLTDQEVNQKVKKIENLLRSNFKAKIR